MHIKIFIVFSFDFYGDRQCWPESLVFCSAWSFQDLLREYWTLPGPNQPDWVGPKTDPTIDFLQRESRKYTLCELLSRHITPPQTQFFSLVGGLRSHFKTQLCKKNSKADPFFPYVYSRFFPHHTSRDQRVSFFCHGKKETMAFKNIFLFKSRHLYLPSVTYHLIPTFFACDERFF